MKVRELREKLVAFDDDTEVYVAPEIPAYRISEGRDIGVPHPLLHHRVRKLHVVGDIQGKLARAGAHYVVLGFHDPKVVEQYQTTQTSMAWKIDSTDSGMVRVKMSGPFSPADFNMMLDELVALKYLRPGTPILFDNQYVDLRDLDHGGLEELSSIFLSKEKSLAFSKVAVLMAGPDTLRLGRQFELMTESKTQAVLDVFLDEQKAVDWLLS